MDWLMRINKQVRVYKVRSMWDVTTELEEGQKDMVVVHHEVTQEVIFNSPLIVHLDVAKDCGVLLQTDSIHRQVLEPAHSSYRETGHHQLINNYQHIQMASMKTKVILMTHIDWLLVEIQQANQSFRDYLQNPKQVRCLLTLCLMNIFFHITGTSVLCFYSVIKSLQKYLAGILQWWVVWGVANDHLSDIKLMCYEQLQTNE